MPRKPVGAVTVNPQHPLSRGLVGAWLLNEQSGEQIRDILRPLSDLQFEAGSAWNYDGSVPGVSNPAGGGAISRQTFGLDNPAGLRGATELSIFIHCRFDSSGTAQTAYLNGTSSSGAPRQGFSLQTFGTFDLYFWNSGGVNHFDSGAQDYFVPGDDGNDVSIAMRWDDLNGTCRYWKNGQFHSNTTIGQRAVSDSPEFAFIGNTDTGRQWHGIIYEVYLWDRWLSDADALALYQDPYAFVEISQPPSLTVVSGAAVFIGAGGFESGAAGLAGVASATSPDFTAAGSFSTAAAELDGGATTLEPVYSSTGAFAAAIAELAGAADVISIPDTFAGSGTFASGQAILAGIGAWSPADIDASGAFDAQPTLVEGIAITFEEAIFPATGEFSAELAQLSGSAITANTLIAAGGWVCEAASLRGTAFLDPTDELGIVIGSIATRPSLRAEVKANDTG